MSDDRPQYGEFATPEEQRRLAGLPPLDPATADLPPAGFGPAAKAPAPNTPTSRVAPAGRFDRIVAMILLGYGLVTVLTSVPTYFDMPELLTRSLSLLGAEGEVTNLGPVRTWGTVAALVMIAGYAVTVWRTARRIKNRQHTWWVPLVGAVVTTALVSACIMGAMMSDPGFMTALQSAQLP